LLTNYFTLRALVHEWQPLVVGARLVDAYSQHKGSLILVLQKDEDLHSFNLSLQSPLRHLFRYSGSNRSRRNVVEHFPTTRHKKLSSLTIDDDDRIIRWGFGDGSTLVMVPFGPRANVIHVDQSGKVISGFKGSLDADLPETRPASMPSSVGDVEDMLRSGKPMRKVWPLFPGPLIDELAFRVGGTEDPSALHVKAQEMLAEIAGPKPRVFTDAHGSPTCSLIELRHSEDEFEMFDSVDEAVRVCARKRMAQARFDGTYRPLLQLLRRRMDQANRSLKRVEQELDKPSRADQYEHLGHLLMALPHEVEEGAEVTQLPDILGDGSLVTIRLDATKTAIENAQRMYERAKSTRTARESALSRVDGLRSHVAELETVLAEAESIATVADVKSFETQHASLMESLRSSGDDPDAIPYRRYDLGQGYEVWVGRNAKQNDELTLRDARAFDLWLHARGVPGSHTVLRVKGRTDSPPGYIIEKAASIAAWHSKARTSGLAPVIYTQRKYVRKPRKAAAGSVRIEREKVVMVEPGFPDSAST